MIPRQKLPKIYIRSGSFYIIKRDVFFKKKSLVGNKTYGFKLEGLESMNIDTKNDLKSLRCILEK